MLSLYSVLTRVASCVDREVYDWRERTGIILPDRVERELLTGALESVTVLFLLLEELSFEEVALEDPPPPPPGPEKLGETAGEVLVMIPVPVEPVPVEPVPVEPVPVEPVPVEPVPVLPVPVVPVPVLPVPVLPVPVVPELVEPVLTTGITFTIRITGIPVFPATSVCV